MHDALGLGLGDVLGPHRIRRIGAVADHLGRDALAHLALTARIEQQAEFGVGVDVYEAGRDHQPGSVQGLRRGCCREIADGANPVAGHPNVGPLPRLTGAVNNGSPTDNEIKLHRYLSFDDGYQPSAISPRKAGI